MPSVGGPPPPPLPPPPPPGTPSSPGGFFSASASPSHSHSCAEFQGLRTELSSLSGQVTTLRETVLRLESNVALEFQALTAKLDLLLGTVTPLQRQASPSEGSSLAMSSPLIATGYGLSSPKPSPLARPMSMVWPPRREPSVSGEPSPLHRRGVSMDMSHLTSPALSATAAAQTGPDLETLRGRKVSLWTGTWNVGAKVWLQQGGDPPPCCHVPHAVYPLPRHILHASTHFVQVMRSRLQAGGCNRPEQ